MWQEAKKKWPTIKPAHVEPNRQSFNIQEKKIQLQIEWDKAFLIAYMPDSSLSEFTEIASDFEKLVREAIEIPEYTRLGFRPIFSKKYDTQKNATKDIIEKTKIDFYVPGGKHFNIEGTPTEAGWSLRIEDSDHGVTLTVKSEKQTVEFNVPLEVEDFEQKKTERASLLFDVDYYTLKSVGVFQLNVRDWLTQAFHLIKRDSKVILGE